MFNHITEKIVSNMEKHHMIQADLRTIYQYGINQMLNMLLNIITFLVIGLVCHMIIETIIFTAAYIPLRIYAGGFHAKTPFRCWIISALMLLIVLSVMKFTSLNIYIYDTAALLATLIILLLSPVEDKNKPLDDKEQHVYKIRCVMVFAAEIIIDILLKFFHFKSFSICLEMVWIALSVMLTAGKIKNIILEKNTEQK
ncbi:accessory gene regulator B family protein [Porcipelethomonas sp.]|uniref:accessory gene regulator B family protein n=1 Tax=Porcipelethomonas sp. TaxID=2981675 RepID=UPI003EF1EDD9